MRVDDRQHEVFFTLYDFRDIRCETIWSIAGRQNRSVVSLNFPMMAPPPKLNGSLIPGFTPWRHLRRNMTPDSLYERLQAIPGFHPKELAWDFERENEVGNDMDRGISGGLGALPSAARKTLVRGRSHAADRRSSRSAGSAVRRGG
jgi:hypothetical protein